MSHARDKIEKTLRAISKAESRGKDTTSWQEYLLGLIDQYHDSKVKVKAGKFGFCTCTETSGICVGCWKIRQSCECVERLVDPDIEMTRQFKARQKGAN